MTNKERDGSRVILNNTVRAFIQKKILEGLSQLPKPWVDKFRQIYAYEKKDLSIEDVVRSILDEKLNFALTAVESNVGKLRINNEKPKTSNIEKDIMNVLKQHAKNSPNVYVNPNFLQELTELLYVYFHIEDEEVDGWVRSIWEM